MSIPLPESCSQVRALDPRLGRQVEDDFLRVLRASEAVAWAHSRLPALVQAKSRSAVLDFLVQEAKAQTSAPSVFALSWTLRGRRISLRALSGNAAADELPPDAQISSSVVGQVAESGRPAWSDDAQADARFMASHSIQGFALRSVGCLPLGKHGALYLSDPEQPGRFPIQVRARLTALCGVAAPFLEDFDAPSPEVQRVPPLPGMVGSSPGMQEVFSQVRAFAPMPWPALVLGETGVGKEGVARALHVLSPRADEPFVAVNCGAIPDELAESTLFGHERGAFTGADRAHEGLVERVRGGTLFLDEVGELSQRAQVKLLRLLQEGTFERVGGQREQRFRGRIVAATLRPLDEARAEHGFREDLFHRLAACVIRVPPLRERASDVPALARHLLQQALAELPGSPALDLDGASLQALAVQTWPGNVRELQNALRMGIARCIASGQTTLTPVHLGLAAAPPPPVDPEEGAAREPSPRTVTVGAHTLQTAVDELQQRMVMDALAQNDGNRTRAAEQLGVTRQWLHRLMQRWENHVPE